MKLALQVAVAHPATATTLVSTANSENIRRNIAAVVGRPDAALLEKVLELLQPIHNHKFTRGRPENRDPVVA